MIVCRREWASVRAESVGDAEEGGAGGTGGERSGSHVWKKNPLVV